MTSVCIYGLGAIGGLIGARLAATGHSVSAVARGETLKAVRQNGLVLEQDGAQRRLPVTVSERPADLGQPDLLILSVKTTALPEVAAAIAPLIGPQTTVLSAMNGIPWWFTHGLSKAPAEINLDRVDPGEVLSRAIPVECVLGCVTHLSARVNAPGQVQHIAGNRLMVGEPTGGCDTPRVQTAVRLLQSAGFEVVPSVSIQQDIWFKLWGNMTVNPVSFLCAATGDEILDDDLVRALMSRCMVEAAQIGDRIGLPIAMDPEERHRVTRQLGAFKTSMLQDLEAGKPVELDALVGVVIDLGQQVQVPTPNLEAVFGLSRLKAKRLRLYPPVHQVQ